MVMGAMATDTTATAVMAMASMAATGKATGKGTGEGARDTSSRRAQYGPAPERQTRFGRGASRYMPQTKTAPDLWQFPLGDELVLVRPSIEGLFLLNSTARLLWTEINRGASRAEVVETFADAFGVSQARAAQDISAALADWSSGILAPPTTPAALHDPAPSESAARAAVTIDCVLNGRGFRVALEPGDLVEEIAPRLARLAVPALPAGLPVCAFTLANGPDRVFVYRDGVCIAREEKTAGARAILLQEMAGLCETGRRPQAILHAGACGTATASVILAGASHAGKSTLCAALMAHGLYCYSDDSAVLDHDFRVAGMPFPVVLRPSSWSLMEPRLANLERMTVHRRAGVDVGFVPSNLPGSSSPSVPVQALLFVEYRAHAPTTLQPLTPFDALLGLQESGFWVEHDRAAIGRFLHWLALLPCHKLTYSSLDEAIATVQGLLAPSN